MSSPRSRSRVVLYHSNCLSRCRGTRPDQRWLDVSRRYLLPRPRNCRPRRRDCSPTRTNPAPTLTTAIRWVRALPQLRPPPIVSPTRRRSSEGTTLGAGIAFAPPYPYAPDPTDTLEATLQAKTVPSNRSRVWVSLARTCSTSLPRWFARPGHPRWVRSPEERATGFHACWVCVS